jgi:hypothetical protein
MLGVCVDVAVVTDKRSLEEALSEAMDGHNETERVETAMRSAEILHKKCEHEAALQKAEMALRLAHRAKRALNVKVRGCLGGVHGMDDNWLTASCLPRVISFA